MRTTLVSILLSTVLGTAASAAHAQTEFHLQHGDLSVPYSGGESERVTTLTLQNASGWSFGSTYAFIDFYGSDTEDGIYDGNFYTEGSIGFSGSKLLDRSMDFGPVSDVGPMAGYSYDRDAKLLKLLAGVQLSIDVPGFTYVTVDAARMFDLSAGVKDGGVPKTDNTWNTTVSWLRLFTIADQEFSFQGFAEYTSAHENELGTSIPGSFLTQPQLRWEANEHWAAGIEASYWTNKFGDSSTDEQAIQLLLVYKP